MKKLLKGFEQDIIDIIKVFGPSFLVVWLLTTFIIANSYIPSGSMESTIMTGSRVMGNRLAYKFGTEPQRGEIIIFRYPDNPKVYFVKRLIGLPGDTVEIKKNASDPGYGSVYINGELLEESYLNEKMEVPEEMSFEVPEDSYFFLGDNRNYSNDARYWEHTYVKKDALVAKVIFQYWKGFKKFQKGVFYELSAQWI